MLHSLMIALFYHFIASVIWCSKYAFLTEQIKSAFKFQPSVKSFQGHFNSKLFVWICSNMNLLQIPNSIYVGKNHFKLPVIPRKLLVYKRTSRTRKVFLTYTMYFLMCFDSVCSFIKIFLEVLQLQMLYYQAINEVLIKYILF